jgi:CheY-like chemotaxis protein
MARILVVDDERVVRDLMRAVLVGAGHDVLEAHDGEEALACIEEAPLPDVILLDLMMPRMDGWRFLEELRVRGLRRQTRVVIVSALSDEDTRSRSAQHGVRNLLAKPFDTDVLLAAVDESLMQDPEDICDRRERVDDLAKLIKAIDALSE